jgi:hypothetical protein
MLQQGVQDSLVSIALTAGIWNKRKRSQRIASVLSANLPSSLLACCSLADVPARFVQGVITLAGLNVGYRTDQSNPRL